MSSLFILAAIAAIVVAAAASLYLYTRTHGENALFTPKMRRLAFVERTYLDGGRKLLLVRRDGVEHLILIGGPIDLVVETGIHAEPLPEREATEGAFAGVVQPYAETARAWQRTDTASHRDKNAGGAPDFSLSLSPNAKAEDMLELTPLLEAKAAK